MVIKKTPQKLDIKNIRKKLDLLDKESILKLVEVLTTLSSKKTSKTTIKTPKKTSKKKKIGRPRKIKVVEDLPEEDSLDEELVQEDEEEVIAPKRRKPKPLNKTKGDKGSPGRVEPFKKIKNRPNLFLKSKFKDMHKNDTLIDKKLNAGRVPTDRGERSTLVEIDCDICGKECIVNENLIYNNGEKFVYKCDNCVGKGAENE